MITISLCMIVKDEEKCIARCLDSIHDIVDEIIIVDTGSVDQTKNIARHYTNKIYDFKWVDDFSYARNYSFSLATKQYIMWLDADDVINDFNRKLLKQLKDHLDPAVNSVTMKYHVNRDQFGNSSFIIKRHRLVRSRCQFKWNGAVHEYLEVNGPIFHSDISIQHIKNKTDNSKRNLMIYEKQLNKGAAFSPRDLFYYANELRCHNELHKAIKYYTLFLTHKEAWKEDKIASCGRLADCYHLLENLEKERESLYKSFEFDSPRADFCCRLGNLFLGRDQVDEAIYWYEYASRLTWDECCMGFYHVPSWTWLPHIKLSFCYYKKGDYKKAYKHNKLALDYLPYDSGLTNNQKLIKNKLKNLT
ncbi:glycosyltransferase family 2 protein [Fictibacillus halophilus]|uniref:glycosyltransferase family 2 protein n=1 Tax=Fictibacillus halophilus TaxID=1610490 RepID=UPI001CFA6FFB|nr:glycosyltransferase family 2 protein [Fictibacillus halophilus]